MEIYLDKRAVKQIRVSASDAVEEGDTDTLREDILEAFNDDQIEEIERRVDNGDFYDFLSEILDEWGGDDVDELFELLETHLAEAGIDVKYTSPDDEEGAPEEEEEEAEVDEPDEAEVDDVSLGDEEETEEEDL
ncbi:MAG: hypothetical protein IPK60_18665 [Sandaracinaceae bacterium]|nr:hypothetical protein [Sandaracinaceae bacterium]